MTLIAELEKKITTEMENKYFPKFEKQAAYLGNGVYSIPATNIYSTDTRELFLMFVAAQENISFKQR
jgi:RNA binding exosome subunit